MVDKETDWDALRAFMPTSFGKQTKEKNDNQEFEKTKREVSYCLRTTKATLNTQQNL